MSPDSVRRKIEQRIAQYEPAWREQMLDPWVRDGLTPVLDRLQMHCVSWEQVIADVERADTGFWTGLGAFYETCVRFNAPAV